MNTPGFIDTWPHPFRRLTDGHTVEVFQLRPDLVDQLRAWAGGQEVFTSGGPAVLLPGTTGLTTRLVELGGFAVRDGGVFHAELADGFYQRYEPATPVAST